VEGEERRTDRFVTQIPGRNILAIRATEDEHALIAQIIERADRPPFQVVIKGLVYSANQDRIRDIGVNITGNSVGGRNAGGIFGDTLGVGTLFDFSTIIGTFDFNIQATAFQQNGVISVKSRPFATVLDGLCTTLSVGTKLPIVIDGSLGVGGGITILNADNLLAVTPYVVDDENGNPIAVTLDLNLQANVIDSSITARGVPAVNSKNIQTQLLLGPDKTAILGGFSIDQDSKTISKVPGLGDIPLIGELFKRRIQDQRLSRLYFAISAEVIPYPKAIEPVKVPGATTDPQTITEEMKKRAEAGEQKPVAPNAPYKKKDN
jgi:type II secretory pathway component GspD/PulD (secretin)